MHANQITNRFFLQSEDDLRDAPLQLRVGQLLHSLDPDVRSFYRNRLGIRERGRIEVLKECLVQIGRDANRSGGLLKYIARYYFDAVENLRDRDGEGADDLRALEELHGTARGILCLDENWRSAAECVDARRLRSLLGKQGWKGQSLDDLLSQLNYPKAVAEDSSDGAKLARSLWEVHEVDRDVLAELAIASESSDFSFADRVRVIADNLALVPETPPARSARTNSEICEALGSPVELQNLALVDPEEIGLGNDAIRVIVPEAADLPRLAARFTDGHVPVLAAVLRALGVPTVDAATLRSRIVADFAAIWGRTREQRSSRTARVARWQGRRFAAGRAESRHGVSGRGRREMGVSGHRDSSILGEPRPAERACHLSCADGRSSATGAPTLGPMVWSPRSRGSGGLGCSPDLRTPSRRVAARS